MTRFWIHIEDAAKFMLDNYQEAKLHIPPIRAARVLDLAEACASYLGIVDFSVKYTGVRAGEKLHESMDFDEMENFHWRSDNETEHYTREELYQLVERTCQNL